MAKYFVLSQCLKIYDAVYFITSFFCLSPCHTICYLPPPPPPPYSHTPVKTKYQSEVRGKNLRLFSQPIMGSLILGFESVFFFFFFFFFFLFHGHQLTCIVKHGIKLTALLKNDIAIITLLSNQYYVLQSEVYLTVLK